jgi:hypothetical protein
MRNLTSTKTDKHIGLNVNTYYNFCMTVKGATFNNDGSQNFTKVICGGIFLYDALLAR